MTNAEATAQAWLTGFRALPKKQQKAVLDELLDDRQVREDMLDLAVIGSRRHEKGRPFEEYLAERGT